MSTLPTSSIGSHSTPPRRVEPVFQQPPRFPEALRLQNALDRAQGRGADLVEFSGPAQPDAAEKIGATDGTLARIGDVPAVESPEAEACARACPPSSPAQRTRQPDGLGRMIDLIA